MTDLWSDWSGEFNPTSAPDYLPVRQLRTLQLHRLRAIVTRAYENVPMYRKRMDSSSVAPDDIAGLDDIVKLPFTEKGA